MDGGQRMNSPDLFISHSSADVEAAEALLAELEKAGLACWLAPRDVPLGGAYQAEIVNAIEHSRAMLLVFSEAANNSEHVLREVELAVQGKKPVYPLRIDRSEPVGGLKYLLANKQWVERRALGGRLSETIVRLLKGPAPAADVTNPPQPAPPVPSASRTARPVVIGGAGLLAVGLIGAAGWLIAPAGLWPAPGQPTSPGDAVAAPSGPQRPTAPPEARPTPVVLPAPPTDASALGEGVHLFRECDACPVMAVVPAGQAVIGSPDHELGRSGNEGPQQTMVIRRPFAVGRTEVSFDEWLACVAE